MKTIVLIAGIFFCSQVLAQSPTWTIQPNICVAQQKGDECLLTFSIETQNFSTEDFCLYLNGQLLSCSQQASFQQQTSVSIKQNSLIELKNSEQQTILSKTLRIKYFERQSRRRRIRPPWSLF